MTWAAKMRRLVEAAVLGQLPARKRSQVVAHLRSDEDVRAEYDLVIEAMRVLEERPVAQYELDLVEQWLFEDGPAAAEAPAARSSAWLRFFGVAFALAAGLVLALGPLRPRPPIEDAAFTAKGATYRSLLAIQALCPRRTAEPSGPSQGLVPAAQEGCGLQDTLSFAYRLDRRANVVGTLSLFAVDEHGDVLYYQPTPVDTEPVAAIAGVWQPLPHAVSLDVNHEPGEVTLYGVVSPQPLTVADIDEAGLALQAASPAAPGQRPWHQRIGDHGRIGTMCAPFGACESAELSFYIDGDAPR